VAEVSKEVRGRAVRLSIDDEETAPGTMLVSLEVPIEHAREFLLGRDYIVTVPEGKQ
jgi:hypothetical protein